MKKTEDFFKFEQKHNLFDIKDKNGFRVWETIRYCVSAQIDKKASLVHGTNETQFNSSLIFTFKRLWRFIIYTLTHRHCHTLFIIDSRTKVKDQYRDIIADGMCDLVDKNDVFIIETTNYWNKKDYKYGTVSPSILPLLLRLNHSKYDFRNIVSLVDSHFNFNLDIRELDYYYSLFITQYRFFEWIFRRMHFERAYYVQNGIHKGFLAAAKQNGIKTFELQHGQISRNHLAYSYPPELINRKEDLYNPDYLLTMGPLWLKDATFPGVMVEPIGNDYYCYDDKEKRDCKKGVLVVSSYTHAEKLKDLVSRISSEDSSFHFYYKLHPYEFKKASDYVDFFSNYDNVEVIRNEQTIGDLLKKSELTLAIQSTAMVEALNAGRHLFVYKVLDYEVLDFIYSEPGVHFVEDEKSFLAQYNTIGDAPLPVGRLFMPFNKETGKKMLYV